MAYEKWSVAVEHTAGVWTDITSRVDTASEHFTIEAGDSAEASADAGSTTLPIQNHDQAFTPGNPLSSQALTPGMRVRIRETVLDQVFDRMTGRVDYPEAEAWTESNEDSPRDQLIMVPLVDEAAWIAKGRDLISTLAEHIIYHGGPALVGYWPMGETEGPDVNPAVGGPWTITQTKRVNGYANAPNAGPGAITYGSAGIPLADDLSSILFEPSLSTDPSVDYVTSLMLFGRRPTSITLSAGQVVTVVCWTRPGEIRADAFQSSSVIYLGSSSSIFTSVGFSMFNGVIFGGGSNGADWGTSVTGPPIPQDQAIPVAIRVGFDPATLELWVRGEIYSATMPVTTPTPATFDQVEIGERYPGAVSHAQIYLGAPDDWTHDDFVAQYHMGLYGLERQSTGERIRTVLQYAGVDPADLGRIDPGASLMQVARMAGRNPMDLVAEAVETEQGEFCADGSGRPVFADRVRLYNI